jgi:aspartyl-tRNA synthetase
LNQRTQDLMMGAPSLVSPRQLRDVHIRLAEPPKASEAEAARTDTIGE